MKFPDATVEQLAEDTLQLSREFFALPLAEKEVLKMLAYIIFRVVVVVVVLVLVLVPVLVLVLAVVSHQLL